MIKKTRPTIASLSAQLHAALYVAEQNEKLFRQRDAKVAELQAQLNSSRAEVNTMRRVNAATADIAHRRLIEGEQAALRAVRAEAVARDILKLLPAWSDIAHEVARAMGDAERRANLAPVRKVDADA